MKRCTKCGQEKALSEYRKSYTTKDKLTTHCASCFSVYHAQYRDTNKERLKQYDKEYAAKNSKLATARTQQWMKDNPERKKQMDRANYEQRKAEGRVQTFNDEQRERNKERSKRWRELNMGKVNAQIAKRRATALRATPTWAEHEQITALYEQARHLTETTGVDHQVDHIVPLNSEMVCGLHCIVNLQILTADANNRKKCKMVETR